MPFYQMIKGHERFTTFLSVALICIAAVAATSENKTSQIFTNSKNITPRDEIYIDDESIEGSGGRGEIHADLEKESDFSGSGFGPDDEDSTTDQHHNTVHQPSLSSAVENSGNTNKNRQDISNRKETDRVTEYELGSGESDVHHDDNEDSSFESVVTENNEINRKEEGGNVDDNGSDIFTIVTDPNEHVADITDRSPHKSAEPGVVSKHIPKQSEINLEVGKSRNPPTDQINLNSEEVLIMNTKNDNRAASFFAQPGILAAVIGGAVVGLLCAILVVMFIVYRMRKKDEGSYALDEPKRSPALNSYAKNGNNREFFA